MGGYSMWHDLAGDFTLEASFYTDYRRIGYYSPRVYYRCLGRLLKKIDMHAIHNIMTLILPFNDLSVLDPYLSYFKGNEPHGMCGNEHS